MVSFLLLGFVLGLVGAFGLGFKKLGLVVSGSCIAGIFLTAAVSNTWFYIGAGLVVFASIVIVIAGLLLRNKAITELVSGIQEIKEEGDNEKLKETQSKNTQRLVQNVKSKLKLKGIL